MRICFIIRATIEIFYFYYYENSCTCRKENLENINEFLKEDLALARRKLDEVATLRGSQVSIKTVPKLSVLSPLAEKIFFDYFGFNQC